MQTKLARNIELAANIAIIAVAILLGYFIVQKLFFQQNTAQPAPPKEIARGTKISLNDINWQANQKTLLLVLQKGCKYCTQSMSFYKTMVEKSKEKGTKLVAVLPNSREESQQYLKENGVDIQEIRQAQLNTVNVQGTPTLILVNDKGEVSKAWIGKLLADQEQEVINNL